MWVDELLKTACEYAVTMQRAFDFLREGDLPKFQAMRSRAKRLGRVASSADMLLQLDLIEDLQSAAGEPHRQLAVEVPAGFWEGLSDTGAQAR